MKRKQSFGRDESQQSTTSTQAMALIHTKEVDRHFLHKHAFRFLQYCVHATTDTQSLAHHSTQMHTDKTRIAMHTILKKKISQEVRDTMRSVSKSLALEPTTIFSYIAHASVSTFRY